MLKARRGFTLVELLVVLAIITILVSFIVRVADDRILADKNKDVAASQISPETVVEKPSADAETAKREAERICLSAGWVLKGITSEKMSPRERLNDSVCEVLMLQRPWQWGEVVVVRLPSGHPDWNFIICCVKGDKLNLEYQAQPIKSKPDAVFPLAHFPWGEVAEHLRFTRGNFEVSNN